MPSDLDSRFGPEFDSLRSYFKSLDLTLNDVRPAKIKGYWELIEPCGGQDGPCKNCRYHQVAHPGQRHVFSYQDRTRGGRFNSPHATWQKAREVYSQHQQDQNALPEHVRNRMRLTISGLYDGPAIGIPDAYISIGNSEKMPGWVVTNRPILKLVFEDIGLRLHEGNPHMPLPRLAHLLLAVQFVQTFHPGWLHIHCAAGVSRSTAVALSVMDACRHPDDHATPAELVLRLLQIRPGCAPNHLLLQEWKDHAGTDFLSAFAEISPDAYRAMWRNR